MGPLDHYAYVTDARHRLLDRVRDLTPDQYAQEFPFGLKSIRRTVHHLAGAERFLIGQFRGGPEGEYPYTYERYPDFLTLEQRWRDQERQIVDTLTAERDWERLIEFRTVPAGTRRVFRVKASPLRIFTQFAYHEVHHRAQIMAMLRQVGAPVENLDYVLLACDAVEENRDT